jgi:glyoxylate reductase
MPKIFVFRVIPDEGLNILFEAFGQDDVTVSPHDRVITRDELLAGVKGADAILPILTDTIDAQVLDTAGPQLQIVANYAVGYNNVDVTAATERGIPVTNTPGVLTETTADLAWTLMFAAARRTGEGERFLRAGKWDGWGPMQFLGVDVHGKTLGIFGMGRIGLATAERAKAFNMPVLYHSINRLSPEQEADLGATAVAKDTLLKDSDFISIHVPMQPDTKHAFGAAEFEAMKDTAVLVNTSRGPIVQEAALVEALQQGKIFAAGLDVYEEEPTVHPGLLECENAAIIPHLGSATHETRGKMARMAAENIVARLSGEVPPNCVNPEVL